MENYSKDLKDQIVNESQEVPRERRFDNRSGRVMGGAILIGIGAVWMAKQYGVEFPEWLFKWPMWMIAFGLFIGAKHSFRGFGWLIPIVVGGIFMVQEIMPEISIGRYGWPLAIILFGLVMIFRPRNHFIRPRFGRHRRRAWDMDNVTSDDSLDSVNIFGGTKKSIISKDFKGGDITTFFGGTDLNLMQADINGTVNIDITQVFGGTKLIVPAHWNIKSDVVCIFGSIEDKRVQIKDLPQSDKVLRLDGTCIFGGIDIRSY